VTVQLDALADESFAAAAAQARGAALVVRLPFGEVRHSTAYPELVFLNGIADLRAPSWSVADLERALAENIPANTKVRVSSRDADTIAQLGPRLMQAGYQAECRVAMVEVEPAGRPLDPQTGVRLVETPEDWQAFAALIRDDAAEHEWTEGMRDQLTRLYREARGEPVQSWFLARVSGDALAYVGLYQHGTVGYLHALFTRPTARRKGVGSSLIQEAAERARGIGCGRLTLQCARDSFLPGFYHGLGFRAVGEMWVWNKPVPG
jgi:GNAT superfamily N-acetyltransferase